MGRIASVLHWDATTVNPTLPIRVLITGGAGNVGGWLARTAPVGVALHVTEHRTPVPAEVAALATVHHVDLVDADAVQRLFVTARPDVVVHTAYVQAQRTAIVDATRNVAVGAAQVGATMVHLSTDVVLSGDEPPYGEEDPLDPTTDYGRWKADAEAAVRSAVPDVCITRTSMVVSIEPLDRVTASLATALVRCEPVKLFDDEMRQPIRAEDLASELWTLVGLDRRESAGVWHLPGPERLDRFTLGVRLAARLGLDASAVTVARAADVAPERPRDPELVSDRRVQLGVRLRPVDA